VWNHCKLVLHSCVTRLTGLINLQPHQGIILHIANGKSAQVDAVWAGWFVAWFSVGDVQDDALMWLQIDKTSEPCDTLSICSHIKASSCTSPTENQATNQPAHTASTWEKQRNKTCCVILMWLQIDKTSEPCDTGM
jgi:hypothetical protein